MKNEYRLKFKKFGRLKFIGHLDLLKVFQQSTKRAKLPVAYSQGFNPHQLTSFALPLTLGYETEGDYVDVEFTEEIDKDEVKESLNNALPKGMEIIDIRKFHKEERAGAALIRQALYEVIMPDDIKITDKDIENFLNQETIDTIRKSKKRIRHVDIKPDIYDLKVDGNKIIARISNGSKKNLKIDLLMEELLKFTNQEYIFYKYKYKRVEMYREINDSIISLMD